MRFEYHRPMKAIALDPDYAKKTSRRFAAGGLAGHLYFNSKKWLGFKDQVFHIFFFATPVEKVFLVSDRQTWFSLQSLLAFLGLAFWWRPNTCSEMENKPYCLGKWCRRKGLWCCKWSANYIYWKTERKPTSWTFAPSVSLAGLFHFHYAVDILYCTKKITEVDATATSCRSKFLTEEIATDLQKLTLSSGYFINMQVVFVGLFKIKFWSFAFLMWGRFEYF